MTRLSWRDSATAAAHPRIRVERFCGSHRYRVHLLGRVRGMDTHYRFGENTVPCLREEGTCPYCADPAWKPKRDYFGPALLMDHKQRLWVPVVAVLTRGAWNLFDAIIAEEDPTEARDRLHRGQVLELWRHGKGNAGGGLLKLKRLSRVEPPVPPFDVEPHLLRLWSPGHDLPPPVELPAAVPFTPEPTQPRPQAEPVSRSPEDMARVRALLAEARRRLTAEPPAATPAAAVVEPATPSGEPTRAAVPFPEGTGGVATISGDVDRLIFGGHRERGPKVPVYEPLTPDQEAEALGRTTGQAVCDDYRATVKLNGKHVNGTHGRKGGAK